MKWALGAALLLVLGASACKKSEPELTPDAGPEPFHLDEPELGLHLSLSPTWVLGPIKGGNSELRVLVDARRAPVGHPYLVAPRLVITVEPTGADGPRPPAERALGDLVELEHQGQLKLTRKVTGERRYGEELAVDLEVAYEVKAPGVESPREVTQRSLFIFRRLPDGTRAIVTLTATFLAEDAALLLPETEATWSGIRLTPPGSTDVDGGAPQEGTSP